MRILTITVSFVLLLITAAAAAEWPQNWLGPKDSEYLSLEIGVYYFSAVLHDFPDDEGGPALPGPADSWLDKLAQQPELGDAEKRAEFDRVRSELDAAAEFIWRNSRFNCALDYVYFTDHSPRLRSEITGDASPYFSPVEFVLYGDARDRYDGLLQIMVLYRYDEETGGLERIKGGGGYTWGCDAETGQCGWSWWAACTADNVCGSDWLVVHEFGHQLDSLFDQSGHPEFWFNHLAPSEGNCARFGEHFDANSYIMRRVPEADWLELQWGTVRTAVDDDGDGVPASDEWLTARGYTTDPDDTTPDVDGDGMTDYEEYMAANGNRNGHGERLQPDVGYCDPLNPDSDSDGLLDAEDPLPMLDLPGQIPNILDFSQTDERWESLSDRGLTEFPYGIDLVYCRPPAEDADYESAIEEPMLGISLFPRLFSEAGEGLEYKLMLDLDNNGWFYGTDNYQLNFTSGEISSFTRHTAASHSEWPHVETVEGDLSQVLDPTLEDVTLIWLPQSLIPEFGGKPGEMIGFNLGVRHEGESWYFMLGEPNTLIQFELR